GCPQARPPLPPHAPQRRRRRPRSRRLTTLAVDRAVAHQHDDLQPAPGNLVAAEPTRRTADQERAVATFAGTPRPPSRRRPTRSGAEHPDKQGRPRSTNIRVRTNLRRNSGTPLRLPISDTAHRPQGRSSSLRGGRSTLTPAPLRRTSPSRSCRALAQT